MPGLIRGVARTAVIAGTATAVSNGVSRRQYGRWEKKAQEEQAQQQPQQAVAQPAPAPAARIRRARRGAKQNGPARPLPAGRALSRAAAAPPVSSILIVAKTPVSTVENTICLRLREYFA